MTTERRPVNSKVRHGNPACARYGCKRPECIAASRIDKRESRARRQQGIRATVPADKAVRHMKALLDAGMPTSDMATLSGFHWKSLSAILNGRRERIHWITEEAILGIPVPEGEWESSSDCYVDAWPAERRLQALGVQGFTIPLLAREAGVDRSVLHAVRSGRRPRIRLSTLKVVKRVFDRLYAADPLDFGVTPGDAARARNWSARQGWFPIEAWADIDDRDCKPAIPPTYVTLAEEANWFMSEYNLMAAEAAERLGVTPNQIGAAMSHYNKAVAKGRVPA